MVHSKLPLNYPIWLAAEGRVPQIRLACQQTTGLGAQDSQTGEMCRIWWILTAIMQCPRQQLIRDNRGTLLRGY